MSDFEGSILKIPQEEVTPQMGHRRPLSGVLGTEVAGTRIAGTAGLGPEEWLQVWWEAGP